MEAYGSGVPRKFVTAFLNSLCKKGVTSFNPGHYPGLRGLVAVSNYLRDKRENTDLDNVVYVDLFIPGPITGVYHSLERAMGENPIARSHFVSGEGTTYYFAPSEHPIFLRRIDAQIVNLANELAEVFATAYRGEPSDE